MRTIELYRYDDGGAVVITPIKREADDMPGKYRLIADEGMELTDGVTVTECVDVPREAVDGWYEVEKQISAEEALAIIVGGGVDA